MAQNQIASQNAQEIDRLATQLAKDPHSKVFMPLADEYGKAGMWEEAVAVLEDGLKLNPGFITAMVALGRAYDLMGQASKAKAILEESVKLSPENLRAHRTLIKIYQSQGLNESALQSCAVILTVNPRDEEALLVQSALRGPLKQQKESELPKPAAPVPHNLSAQTATPPLASAEFRASAPATKTESDLSVSTTAEPKIASTLPRVAGTEPMETDLHTHDRIGDHLVVPELNPHVNTIVVSPSPSNQAGLVAQLEAWLRTIESRRHDRATANESHPKVS